MAFKEAALKSFTKSQENTCIEGSSLIKVQAKGFQLYQNETLAKTFSREFFQIFHGRSFIDEGQVTGSVLKFENCLMLINMVSGIRLLTFSR